MTTRDPALQALLDALIAGLAARTEPGTAPANALARVQAALATAGEAGSPPGPAHNPPLACSHLPFALAAAQSSGGAAATAATALAALGSRITWYIRQGSESACANFEERHALATMVGSADRPGPLEIRDDLRVGISLVAPGTPYPDHRHPPEELYLALTAGEWRQERGPWFEPGAGGIVYNSANILHGMRAGSEPQLSLWCLPLPRPTSEDRMPRSDFRYSWPTRVRYSEMDNQGIVFNSHYLTYFDCAITEYLVTAGYYEAEVVRTGHDFHAVRAVVEWQAPIGKREDIEVFVRPGRIGRSSLTFTFEIHAAGRDDLRTTGEVVWVYTDQAAHRSAPLPQTLLDALEAYEGKKARGGLA